MAFLVVVGAWLVLAPVVAWAIGAALHLADRVELPAPADEADAACCEETAPAELAAASA